MSRLRRQQSGAGGSKQVSQTVVHNGDQPPSYEDTMKTGPVSGGFVDPGLPVKTIVQVVQVKKNPLMNNKLSLWS